MTQIDTVPSTPLGKTKMSGPFQECRIQEWVLTSLVFPPFHLLEKSVGLTALTIYWRFVDR